MAITIAMQSAFLHLTEQGGREMRKLIRDALDMCVCSLNYPRTWLIQLDFPIGVSNWRGHLVGTCGV